MKLKLNTFQHLQPQRAARRVGTKKTVSAAFENCIQRISGITKPMQLDGIINHL